MQHAGVRAVSGLGARVAVSLASTAFLLVSVQLVVVAGTRGALFGETLSCSNRLRGLALSMTQYTDDKRFFPHVNRIRQLDGDYDSSHSVRKARSLVFYGYVDDPSLFVCPASGDRPPAITSRSTSGVLGAWQSVPRKERSQFPSPFVDDRSPRSLRESPFLSYGFHRKGLNSGTRSTSVLLADRAVASERPRPHPGDVGNHVGGFHVAYADATVEWVSVSPAANARAALQSVDVDPTAEWVPSGQPQPKPSRISRLLPHLTLAVGSLLVVACFFQAGDLATDESVARS